MRTTLIVYLLCYPMFSSANDEAQSFSQPKTQPDSSYELPEEDSVILPTVDSAQALLHDAAQHSASWLDSIAYNEEVNDKASAKGYLKLSWLPRTADLANLDAKFKINLHLPKWNDRLSLAFDNDDEDEIQVDYESTTFPKVEAQDPNLNLAFQYIKNVNNDLKLKYRIGASRGQLYARSEVKFHWQTKKLTISLKPRIDYYNQDGWGPGVKGSLLYSLTSSQLSLSASWQNIEAERRSRRKSAFYHIKPLRNQQLLISGLQYQKDNIEDDLTHSSYFASVRYRKLFHKNWLYYEVEPFVEFNQVNDYHREFGIIFSLLTYYGHR